MSALRKRSLSNTIMSADPDLTKIVARFAAHYGKPGPPLTTDPFELVLLESVAYLVDDKRREEAFRLLREHAGTKPHQILAAAPDKLLRVTSLGGMHPEQRPRRRRDCR